ncbi:MAG: hypothetical protein U9O94_10580 [Nanoarchaeota archaeon]|nr:hypothetical protein [Nanoarchaeota archaeon]
MSYDDDKEDEEISVDFSKIKSFFKKKTEKDSVKSVEKEAEVVSILPLNFFTIEEAAKILKKEPKETQEILDGLADKGLMLDTIKKNPEGHRPAGLFC